MREGGGETNATWIWCGCAAVVDGGGLLLEELRLVVERDQFVVGRVWYLLGLQLVESEVVGVFVVRYPFGGAVWVFALDHGGGVGWESGG